VKEKTALIVVDAQVNMFDEKFELYRAKEVLQIIADLLSKARAANVPVYYLQNEGNAGDPDERGTEGWKICPTIVPKEDEAIIPKSKPDGFEGTSLQRQLDQHGVRSLVVVGMQSEFCVSATCAGARSRGFKVTLVKDGHTTFNGKERTASEIIQSCNEALKGKVELRPAAEIDFKR
jgi:nicotinamidase-related amidase